jgi:DNA polymerase-1
VERLAHYREVWVVDTEFHAPPGERPTPICLCACELRTGRRLRLWLWDDASARREPAFPVGPDVLFVAYFASAELGVFLSLGWPLPSRILDLYAEFRLFTSGIPTPCGSDLIGALVAFGYPALDAMYKEDMRRLAMQGGPFYPRQQRELLDYCLEDAEALNRLLPAMLPYIDLPRALLRGRYMAAVARIEVVGTPLDTDMLAALRDSWESLQDRLIERIDAAYGFYDGRYFDATAFERWLVELGILWPRLKRGDLALSEEVFGEMALTYPVLKPLHDLRVSLAQLREWKLAVGTDGRNRCLLSPFGARTGRNTPSTSAFIFGLSSWLRSLIRPAAGMALAYVDYEQQEFGIGAALSCDAAMMNAYRSGDPYLSFAKQARAVPADATKKSHKAERDLFKVCALGVQYGMQAESLARRMGRPTADGRELLHLHQQTYPTYWRWSDNVQDFAMLYGRLETVFGWRVHVGLDANPRSLRNFPLQGNGAEMLRLACCLATERGVRVCAPVHDALLVEGPAYAIREVVAETQKAMREASELVLPGFPLRTDAKIVSWPERYVDDRGRRMWELVQELLSEGRKGRRTAPIMRDTLPLSRAIAPSILISLPPIGTLSKGAADEPRTIRLGADAPLSCRTPIVGGAAQGEAAETPARRAVPLRPNPVAMADPSGEAERMRHPCRPDALAGKPYAEVCNGEVLPVAHETNGAGGAGGSPGIACLSAGRLGNGEREAGPRPGCDLIEGSPSQFDIETAEDADEIAERAAISWEGCLQEDVFHKVNHI